MENIANLQIERHPAYDKVGNPQRLTVSKFTPVGLTRHSASAENAVRVQSGVIGILLVDASGVAVVEAPCELSANRAHIANADGSLRAQIPARIGAEPVMFYDVSKVKGSAAFLAAAPGSDVRNEVRESDGLVVPELPRRTEKA